MNTPDLVVELNVRGNYRWELVAVTGLDGALTSTDNTLVAVLKQLIGQGVRRRGM